MNTSSSPAIMRDLSKPALRRGLGEQPPIAVSMQEACALLGIGMTTGWKLAREGRLDTFKVGRSRRVLLSSVQRVK